MTAYQQRPSAEPLFRDYKSGGYNLAGVRVSSTHLSALLLLIAITYSSALIAGVKYKKTHLQRYICRPKEAHRQRRRHSNFWAGCYAQAWLESLEECADWVTDWCHLNRNEQPYYQRAYRAATLMLNTS